MPDELVKVSEHSLLTTRSCAGTACCRWWKNYSHRKNDEDDMVADSLLYDERCHLPRTTPGPKPVPEPEVGAAAKGAPKPPAPVAGAAAGAGAQVAAPATKVA